MEYVKLLVAVVLMVGAVGMGLVVRRRASWRLRLTFLTALAPFLADNGVLFSPFFDEQARAPDRGFAFTLVDMCSIALLAATQSPSKSPPFRIVIGAYLSLVALSVLWCSSPAYGLFGLWTVFRASLIYWALSRSLADPRALSHVLYGWAAGLTYVAVMCVKLRYLDGRFQVPGPYPHQNLMVTCVCLVTPTILVMLLSCQNRPLLLTGLFGGILAVLMSLSRAGLAILPASLALVYLGSVTLRISLKKLAIGLAGAVVALAAAIKAADSILERIDADNSRSNESRWLYERMTSAMADEHPIGIGYNQFALVIDNYRYLLDPSEQWVEHGALVHNIYVMTHAELGYLGLLLLLALWGRTVLHGAWHAYKLRADVRAELLIGCCVGLLTLFVQGNLEWTARTGHASYLYWSLWAVIGALPRHTSEQVKSYTL